jgi:peptide/nickel transport system permease protein
MSTDRPVSEEASTINDPEESQGDGPVSYDTMVDHDPLPNEAHVMTDSNVPVDVVTPEVAIEPGLDPVAQMIARRPKKKRRSILVIFCSVWLGLMVGLAIFAPYLPFRDPAEISSEVKLRPGFRWHEPLGTDALGRSQLSRVAEGARVSLAVGIGAMAIGITIGTILGLTMGYFAGRTDTFLLVLIDALLAFPPLVLLLALVSVLTPSLKNEILALGFIGIPTFARIARANTMVMVRREFVMAAKVMGAKNGRVLTREVLPNLLIPIMSYAFLIVAALMIADGSLSFLGLGIPPPTPSWGSMIAAGQPNLQRDPHLVFVPAVFLFLTVFSLNTVGDRARAKFDTKTAAI